MNSGSLTSRLILRHLIKWKPLHWQWNVLVSSKESSFLKCFHLTLKRHFCSAALIVIKSVLFLLICENLNGEKFGLLYNAICINIKIYHTFTDKLKETQNCFRDCRLVQIFLSHEKQVNNYKSFIICWKCYCEHHTLQNSFWFMAKCFHSPQICFNFHQI